MCVCVRDRYHLERARERARDRQSERERERGRERLAERENERGKERWRLREKDRKRVGMHIVGVVLLLGLEELLCGLCLLVRTT